LWGSVRWGGEGETYSALGGRAAWGGAYGSGGSLRNNYVWDLILVR
jgi:hypothetical protein